jgi:hypothetical protein
MPSLRYTEHRKPGAPMREWRWAHIIGAETAHRAAMVGGEQSD